MSIFILILKNSNPKVDTLSSLNIPFVARSDKQLFPTPEFPMSIILKTNLNFINIFDISDIKSRIDNINKKVLPEHMLKTKKKADEK